MSTRSARSVVALALIGVASGCGLVFDLSALGPAADPPDAGNDAGNDVVNTGPHTCPTGEGPTMVSAGEFCIDSTEVTNAQYARFVEETKVTRPVLPASCSFKTSFVPPQGWPVAQGELSLPVRYVDWCDAHAYCTWTKKRLCGALAGGGLRASNAVDPSVSQWAIACTGAKPQTYPYGASFEEGRCNARADASVPASTRCEGGLAGIFDMVGNVAEWLDACESETGTEDACRVAGGSFESAGASATCQYTAPSARRAAQADQGIRCCSP